MKPPSRASWAGSILFTERSFAYAGPVAPTEVHAHHAIQIAFSMSGDLVLADEAGTEAAARAFIIPADAPHAIRRPCERALFVFVDPEDAIGHAAGTRVAGPNPEDWSRAAVSIALPAREDLREVAAAALATVAPLESSGPELHPAVRAALERLPALVAEGKVSMAALAKRVGISEGRLSHVFGQQVGIPLRPYVIWLRLRLAVSQIGRGASLTEAAHAAGFSDGAHFSNAFRRMFGLAPSDIASHATWVE